MHSFSVKLQMSATNAAHEIYSLLYIYMSIRCVIKLCSKDYMRHEVVIAVVLGLTKKTSLRVRNSIKCLNKPL